MWDSSDAIEIGDRFRTSEGPLEVYRLADPADANRMVKLVAVQGRGVGSKYGIPERELGTRFAREERDAAEDCLPPKGSRLSSKTLSGSTPALRIAVEAFQSMFDRRPTIAELAAIGHGIDAAREVIAGSRSARRSFSRGTRSA